MFIYHKTGGEERGEGETTLNSGQHTHFSRESTNFVGNNLFTVYTATQVKLNLLKVMNHFLRHDNVKCLDTIPQKSYLLSFLSSWG